MFKPHVLQFESRHGRNTEVRRFVNFMIRGGMDPSDQPSDQSSGQLFDQPLSPSNQPLSPSNQPSGQTYQHVQDIPLRFSVTPPTPETHRLFISDIVFWALTCLYIGFVYQSNPSNTIESFDTYLLYGEDMGMDLNPIRITRGFECLRAFDPDPGVQLIQKYIEPRDGFPIQIAKRRRGYFSISICVNLCTRCSK